MLNMDSNLKKGNLEETRNNMPICQPSTDRENNSKLQLTTTKVHQPPSDVIQEEGILNKFQLPNTLQLTCLFT